MVIFIYHVYLQLGQCKCGKSMKGAGASKRDASTIKMTNKLT